MSIEEEKIEKYKDLAYEIKSLWKMEKVTIIPVVIGALGSVRDRLDKLLNDIQKGIGEDPPTCPGWRPYKLSGGPEACMSE